MGHREAEAISDIQLDALIGEAGNSDLRSLQVPEESNMASQASGGGADQLCACPMLVWCTVGKIQTGHIHPGQDHLLDDLRAGTGGTYGGDDLGSA
ncbi:hypothetical protein D9M69_413140 [compost metagenome]